MRLTAITRSKSASVHSVTGTRCWMPALLTRMSSRPCVAAICAIAAMRGRPRRRRRTAPARRQALAAQALGDLGQRARIAAVERARAHPARPAPRPWRGRGRARRRSPGRCARRAGTDRTCFPYRPGSGNKPAGRIRGGQVTKVQRERAMIKAAGRSLAVQRLQPAAAAAGPTLVFLHEGLGCIALWKDFPTRLVRAAGPARASSTTAGATGSRSRSTGRAPRRYLHDEAQRLPAGGAERGRRRAQPSWSATATAARIALLFAARVPERPGRDRHRGRARLRRGHHRWPASAPRASPMPTTDLAAPPRPLSRRQDRRALPGLARRLAVARVPELEHRGRAAARHLPALVLQGADDEYGTPAQVEAIARGVSRPGRERAAAGLSGTRRTSEAAERVLDLIADFVRPAILGRAGRPGLDLGQEGAPALGRRAVHAIVAEPEGAAARMAQGSEAAHDRSGDPGRRSRTGSTTRASRRSRSPPISRMFCIRPWIGCRPFGSSKVTCGTHTRSIQPLSIAGRLYHQVG